MREREVICCMEEREGREMKAEKRTGRDEKGGINGGNMEQERDI